MMTDEHLELLEVLALGTGNTADVPLLVAEIRQLRDALIRALPYVQAVWAMQFMQSDHRPANSTSLLAMSVDDRPAVEQALGLQDMGRIRYRLRAG